MKSQLFKTAWKLVKEMNMTFSEALTLSWKSFKNNVKVVINKTWKGINVLAFNIGNCTSSTIESVIEMNANYKKADNSGAKLYYDGKTFNND